MDKYTYIKEITKHYLDGNLSKIKMEYGDVKNTVVDVIYEDDNSYSFDYQIQVDNNSKQVKFLSHYCTYANDHFDLKRFRKFEDEVAKYLFHQ